MASPEEVAKDDVVSLHTAWMLRVNHWNEAPVVIVESWRALVVAWIVASSSVVALALQSCSPSHTLAMALDRNIGQRIRRQGTWKGLERPWHGEWSSLTVVFQCPTEGRVLLWLS